MSIIACTTTDVLGHGCPCEQNGWEHEWGPASPRSERRLHWCGNCDCCVADITPDTESQG